VFYTRHGRAPLLRFLNRNPTAAELETFVADISNRIQRARTQWDNRQQFLSAELKEHRRLKDQGILTPESYEAVKRRILGKHG
jgi:ribosome-binding protein aMBF1 (putative translation factor)